MPEENISLKLNACLKLADDIVAKLRYLIDGGIPENKKRPLIRPGLQEIGVGLDDLEATLRFTIVGPLGELGEYLLHGGAECKPG